MQPRILFLIAQQELTIQIRNRWTILFAGAFGLLVFTIAYFGMATTGYASFQNFTRTSASLLNLILYIVPMVSLLMSTLSFTGEKGTPELLFTQPIRRIEILLGKLLGLFFSMAISMLCGFAISGVIIAWETSWEGMIRYLALVGLTLLLSLVFLTLGALISLLSHRQFKAFGVSFFLWFFFVLFYDILIFGGTLFLQGKSARIFLFCSLLGNPVDMIRIVCLILLDGVSIFGVSGALLVRFFGGTTSALLLFFSTLIFWFLLPLGFSWRLLEKENIG